MTRTEPRTAAATAVGDLDVRTWNPDDPPSAQEIEATASFLHEHLDRYGDPIPQIRDCLAYATDRDPARGGTVTLARADGRIVGAVVTNRTGMGGYIPENILVYIAVHGDARGRGLGRRLMRAALDAVEGDVALHVEPDNPARRLYESLGFTSKYLEMRFAR